LPTVQKYLSGRSKSAMKRILFVDDDRKVLDGLRRMLHSLRREWDMEFAESGREALARLAARPFDVVVTDMRMPAMDGSQLLHEVILRHPATVRIILSGQCDRATVLKAVGPTHQFLTKPSDAGILKSTVARACALRDRLPDDRLKRMVTCVQRLPSRVSCYRRLAEEMESPSASSRRAGEIIARDAAMTAKVIQLVNSGFFGTPQRVSDPVFAADLLGVEAIRALTLSTDAFAPLGAGECERPFLEKFNAHSLAVAAAAAAIVRAETDERSAIDDAWLAGLLHDVGVLVMAGQSHEHCVDLVAAASLERADLRLAAQHPLPTARDDVAAYLLELWGIPEAIVRAVAWRSCPGRCGENTFGPLTAVHVASALIGGETDGALGIAAPIDRDYLASIGCGSRLDAWKAICRAEQLEGVTA
jgi:HD-like signal output (HDOD) protein/CheY-like chemotaxis protein